MRRKSVDSFDLSNQAFRPNTVMNGTPRRSWRAGVANRPQSAEKSQTHTVATGSTWLVPTNIVVNTWLAPRRLASLHVRRLCPCNGYQRRGGNGRPHRSGCGRSDPMHLLTARESTGHSILAALATQHPRPAKAQIWHCQSERGTKPIGAIMTLTLDRTAATMRSRLNIEELSDVEATEALAVHEVRAWQRASRTVRLKPSQPMTEPDGNGELSAEQQDTTNLLERLLGRAIADRYVDFCRLASGVFELRVARPVAAHASLARRAQWAQERGWPAARRCAGGDVAQAHH